MNTPKRFFHSINRGTYTEKWEVSAHTEFKSKKEKWHAHRAGVHLSGFESAESIVNALNTRPALNWRKDEGN
jgi:hypothetical protein